MADSVLFDPLNRRVILHDRTWFGHIVKGHPDVAEYRAYIEAAVTAPREIRISLSDPACRLYFGKVPESDTMTMVVADVSMGLVKTAHLARKPSGGRIEWSSPTP